MRLTASAAGARVDTFVAAATGLGRRRLARAFEDGLVRVNGRRAKKGAPLAVGDLVDVDDAVLAAAGPPVAEPDVALVVVHEDARLVAVDKPAGVPSHPLRGERGTIAGALVARFPECATAGDDPREGGLVHRLDTGTSGVLVAARDAAAWRLVRAAFGDGRTTKTYLALVSGAPAAQTIATPLHGQPASTTIAPVATLGAFALVRATMSTGRRHQVRLHLAGIGCPIVGDADYGGAPRAGLIGHCLHAESITLPHPDGGDVTIRCAPPAWATA